MSFSYPLRGATAVAAAGLMLCVWAAPGQAITPAPLSGTPAQAQSGPTVEIAQKKSRRKTSSKTSKRSTKSRKKTTSSARKAKSVVTRPLPEPAPLPPLREAAMVSVPLLVDPDGPDADMEAVRGLGWRTLRVPARPQIAAAVPQDQPPPRLPEQEIARPTAADTAAMEQCQSEQAAAARAADACIGLLANACAERAGNEMGAAVAECIERERRVWAAQLEAAFDGLAGTLPSDKAAQMRDAQEAWADFRQRNCGFFQIFYSGEMAAPLAGYCTLRETARRSIELGSLLHQARER